MTRASKRSGSVTAPRSTRRSGRARPRSPRPAAQRALWKCPRCGHWFVTRNLWHSCERVPIASHFVGRDPAVRRVWRALLAAVRAIGPVKLSPNRTRIAIMTRMRFCAATVRRDHLRCSIILGRRVQDPRVVKYEFLPPRYHLHWVRLDRPERIDATVRAWLAESYRVGEQQPPAGERARRTDGTATRAATRR